MTTRKQKDSNLGVQSDVKKRRNTKDRNLRKRYGITIDDYEQMLETQDYKCAICGKPHDQEAKGLQTDHNHKTGRVRGLLCLYCNRKVVGRVGDDKKRMIGMIKYIQKQLAEDKKWK